MDGPGRRLRGTAVLLLAMAAGGAVCHAGAQGGAVAQLDLRQFVGRWYEVAHLPNKQEKTCDRDEVTLYTLRNKARHLAVVQSCLLKDGTAKTRNFNAKTADKSGDGKLKVSYTFPFSHKYWVFALGQGYSWAVVGGPDHKTLWLLARMPEMDAAGLAEMKGRASAAGFDVTKLVSRPQTGQRQPAEKTATPPAQGAPGPG